MSIPDQQGSVIDALFDKLQSNLTDVIADTALFIRYHDGMWELCTRPEQRNEDYAEFMQVYDVGDVEVILKHENLMEFSLLVKEMSNDG